METHALIFVLAGLLILAISEMRWRDKLNGERLSAKDRECLARVDGTTDGAADVIRKLRWRDNDDARAAMTEG